MQPVAAIGVLVVAQVAQHLRLNERTDDICPAARADEDEAECIIRSITKGAKHVKIIHDVVCRPHNVTLPHALWGLGSTVSSTPVT